MSCSSRAQRPLERRFQALGTEVRLVCLPPVGAERPARRALVRAVAWLHRAEAALSRFQPESELCRLNAAGGRAVVASPLLMAALRAALEVARETGGLVNPALLPELEAAGYRGSLTHRPVGPAVPPSPGQALPLPPGQALPLPPGQALPLPPGQALLPPEGSGERWREIALDPRYPLVTLPPGVRIDLGGSAKGWLADQMATYLAGSGPAAWPAAADLGGDIRVILPPGSPPWPVTVANPLEPEEDLAWIHLARGGIATSSPLYRAWHSAAGPAHHIIDPRTGQPAATDLAAVTAVAPTALQAEAWAKAALILGREAGLAYLEARSIPALLVTLNGSVYMTTALRGYQVEYVGGYLATGC